MEFFTVFYKAVEGGVFSNFSFAAKRTGKIEIPYTWAAPSPFCMLHLDTRTQFMKFLSQ